MKKLVLLFIALVAFPLVSFAHSGRTDSSGGHYNRKTGGYHYHGGAKYKPPSTTNQSQTAEQGFWLNTKSGVRHNQNCRWYANTSSGRASTENEGRACKICGG